MKQSGLCLIAQIDDLFSSFESIDPCKALCVTLTLPGAEKELDREKFLDLLESVEIHVTDMLIRFLKRKNPKSPNRAACVKKLLNPLRTQVRAVRLGTPPDYEDGLVEVRNRRLGSAILSYHQLVALMAQAKDGRHLAQLGNTEIRAAKKLRKLTRKDISESEKLH